MAVKSESLPKRHFTDGERKLVGFRLPASLTKEIKKLADTLGWNITDVAQTALDQYVHSEMEKERARKK